MSLKPGLAWAYRALTAPVGRRRVDRLIEDGLPSSLHLPLRSLFSDVLTPEDRDAQKQIEVLRSSLASGDGTYTPIFGQGRLKRSPAALASNSAVDAHWGMFLRLCVRASEARSVLEMGSSAGISGCYLSSPACCETFVTLEGSSRLAALARENITRLRPTARVVQGLFRDTLEDVIAGFPHGVDLAFVDGPKTEEGISWALDRIIPAMRPGSLVVFDDVHWSPEMWHAWRRISRRPGFTHTVNAGRFGLALWGGGSSSPASTDLSTLTGWLRIGKGLNTQ